MPIVIGALLLLAGFLAGCYLQLHVLLFISFVSVLVGLYMAHTYKEIASLIAVAYVLCAVIGNVAMWLTFLVTYYQSAGISEWLHTYIVR